MGKKAPGQEGGIEPGKPRPGIPSDVSIEYAKEWVRPKVSEKRWRHVAGTAAEARRLALKAGADAYLAELAAWLHDACKEVKDTELVAMAERRGLLLTPLERSHGHILHGPVAALVVEEELGITQKAVLEAISQHTLGEAPMSLLAKIMFLADCIDETRPLDYRQAVLAALDPDGALDLDLAVLTACDLGLKLLIDGGKPIHPRTIAVRNHYLTIIRRR